MHFFNQETVIQVLEEIEGVKLLSYGKPRDAFSLPVDVPFWTSGYGGEYEMKHTHVPAGAMIAVGDLESLNISDMKVLKSQLKTIDIYPTGHSGDFKGKDLEELHDWFWSRSRLDNDVNNQTPISHVKKLTPGALARKLSTNWLIILSRI